MFSFSKRYYYFNESIGKMNLYINCTLPNRVFHINYPLYFERGINDLNLELTYTNTSNYNTIFGNKTFLNICMDCKHQVLNGKEKVIITNHLNNQFEFIKSQEDNYKYVNNELDYVCSYSETSDGDEFVLTDKYGNSYTYVGEYGLFPRVISLINGKVFYIEKEYNRIVIYKVINNIQTKYIEFINENNYIKTINIYKKINNVDVVLEYYSLIYFTVNGSKYLTSIRKYVKNGNNFSLDFDDLIDYNDNIYEIYDDKTLDSCKVNLIENGKLFYNIGYNFTYDSAKEVELSYSLDVVRLYDKRGNFFNVFNSCGMYYDYAFGKSGLINYNPYSGNIKPKEGVKPFILSKDSNDKFSIIKNGFFTSGINNWQVTGNYEIANNTLDYYYPVIDDKYIKLKYNSTLKQVISEKGSASDYYSLVMMVSAANYKTYNFNLSVIFKYAGSEVYRIDDVVESREHEDDRAWLFYKKDITPFVTFDNIEIYINNFYNNDLYLSSISIFNKNLFNKYYWETSNIKKIIKDTITSNYDYNVKNIVIRKINDNGIKEYEYDDNNNLTKETNGYGAISEYSYDEYNNVLSEKHENDNYYYEMSNVYDASGEYLTKSIFNNKTIEYTYDKEKNVLSSITDGSVTEEYSYNFKRELEEKSILFDNKQRDIQYGYNGEKLININTSLGGYSFNYDENKIKSISIKKGTNKLTLQNYEYQESNDNNYFGYIQSINDKTLVYNADGSLNKEESNIYQNTFEYNNKQLVIEKNYKDNVLFNNIQYTYDLFGNIESVNSLNETVKINSDSSNRINNIKYTKADTKFYEVASNITEYKRPSRKEMRKIINYYNVASSFYDSHLYLTGINVYYTPTLKRQIDLLGDELSYAKILNGTELGYSFITSNNLDMSMNIGYSLEYITSIDKIELFKVLLDDEVHFSVLYENGNLKYEIDDEIMIINEKLADINLLSIGVKKDGNNLVYNIINNGNVKSIIKPFVNNKPLYFKIMPDNRTNSSDGYMKLYAVIKAEKSKYDYMMGILSYLKDYLIFTDEEEENTNIIKCKYDIDINDGRIIVPLMGSFTSLDNIKPIESFNKISRAFKCSNNDNQIGYIADGQKLAYEVFNQGYVEFDVNNNNDFSLKYGKNYICTIRNNNISISLYLNNEGDIILSINNNIYNTGIKILINDVYYKIKLLWKYENGKYKVIVSRDGVEYEKDIAISLQSNLILYLGGKYKEDLDILVNPFYGLISNLIISDSLVSEDIDIESTISKINSLGMVIDTSVYKNNNHIINTSYEYESSNSDEKKINGRIKRQNINKNSSDDILYTYMYNNNDNIISIKKGDNEEEWKSYQYNSNNELISENITSEIDSININCTINYTYDEYGNIIRKEIIDNANESITQKEFEYTSNLSPYLLTKYNNKEIMYDLYGNINKYGIIYNNEVTEGYTYTYEMGLLRTVNKVGTDSNTYNYLYDSSGRRVQKIVGVGNTNAIKRYKYTYIGDMLINETLSNDGVGVIKEVEYLYDNNGLLYGLKYNGNNYYYVRDLTGCINQIINEAGNIVHEYLYDAYGNIIYQYGIMQGINSFIYKGYYYDEETQLYWVSSRYYSPELCRWISPDSIEYLDPESINGLNLYAYCGNDPVMCS